VPCPSILTPPYAMKARRRGPTHALACSVEGRTITLGEHGAITNSFFVAVTGHFDRASGRCDLETVLDDSFFGRRHARPGRRVLARISRLLDRVSREAPSEQPLAMVGSGLLSLLRQRGRKQPGTSHASGQTQPLIRQASECRMWVRSPCARTALSPRRAKPLLDEEFFAQLPDIGDCGTLARRAPRRR